MTMKPMMLGFVALLGACGGGGGGTPAVEDTPVTPEPEAQAPEQTPEQAPEEPAPAPATPPDPVTFVFDTDGQSDVTVTADTFVYDGVTYQIDDLRLVLEDGDSALFVEAEIASATVGLAGTRVIDGDALAAVATLLPGGDTEFYEAATTGGVFAVPTLGNTPVGEATFRGDYVGLFLARGPLNANGSRVDDAVGSAVFGDVILDVDFTEFLSESSFSGVIENREHRNVNDSEINSFIVLNDVVIENGRFDDTGQITADVSGGAWAFRDFVGPGDDIFDATPGTLIGQLGGDDSTVVAGTLQFEHQEFVSSPPDFERTDVLSGTITELGGFVARQE